MRAEGRRTPPPRREGTAPVLLGLVVLVAAAVGVTLAFRLRIARPSWPERTVASFRETEPPRPLKPPAPGKNIATPASRGRAGVPRAAPEMSVESPIRESSPPSGGGARSRPRAASLRPIMAAELARSAPGPVLALILDDVGGDLGFVREATLRLPNEIAFAVIPHRDESDACAALARERGFTVICHLPMEPFERDREEGDLDVVRVSMSDMEIVRRVEEGIDAVPFAVGLNNHEGSLATTNVGLLEAALSVVRARGLFFIDSRTTTRSVAGSVARRLGIPTASRDVFLDDDPDPSSIERQVAKLISLARTKGRALGIAHARTGTLDVLEELPAALRRSGVALVPIDEFVRATRSLGDASLLAVRQPAGEGGVPGSTPLSGAR